jgi:hypothetical protein
MIASYHMSILLSGESILPHTAQCHMSDNA